MKNTESQKARITIMNELGFELVDFTPNMNTKRGQYVADRMSGYAQAGHAYLVFVSDTMVTVEGRYITKPEIAELQKTFGRTYEKAGTIVIGAGRWDDWVAHENGR